MTTAEALAHMPASQWPTMLAAISRSSQNRLRLYGPDGRLLIDSWRLTGPTYALLDPNRQGWAQGAARWLDRGFNALVGARPLDEYVEPASDRIWAWPEAVAAQSSRRAVTIVRNAPDLTPVISAAVPVHNDVLLATHNDRAFTETVHNQRGGDRGRDGVDHRAVVLPVAVPGADHRAALAAPRDRRASRAASAGRARCASRACPRAATRSDCSPARSRT